MLFLIFIFAASFVVSVPLSSELRSSYTVKETHNVPEKWLRVGPASGDEFIKLQIALRQSNPGELERRLYEGTSLFHIENLRTFVNPIRTNQFQIQVIGDMDNISLAQR